MNANHMLGRTINSMDSRIIPMVQHSKGVWKIAYSFVSVFSLHILEWVQQWPTKIVRRLKHMTCEETKVFAQPREEEASGGLIIVFSYQREGSYRQDRARLFSGLHSQRIRGSNHNWARKILIKHKEESFPHELSQSLQQVSQTGCIISTLGDNSKLDRTQSPQQRNLALKPALFWDLIDSIGSF